MTTIPNGNITLNCNFNELDSISQILLILNKKFYYNEHLLNNNDFNSNKLLFDKTNSKEKYLYYNFTREINLNTNNDNIICKLKFRHNQSILIDYKITSDFNNISVINNAFYDITSRSINSKHKDKSINNIIDNIKIFNKNQNILFEILNNINLYNNFNTTTINYFTINKFIKILENIDKLNLNGNDIIFKENKNINNFISLIYILLKTKFNSYPEISIGPFSLTISTSNVNNIIYLYIDGIKVYTISDNDINYLDIIFNYYINAFLNLLEYNEQYNEFISKIELLLC